MGDFFLEKFLQSALSPEEKENLTKQYAPAVDKDIRQPSLTTENEGLMDLIGKRIRHAEEEYETKK